MSETEKKQTTTEPTRKRGSFKSILLYFSIYVGGIVSFLIFIAEPFTMRTYFSDNSLLPGLVNREFSLETEAEYYLKHLEKASRPIKGTVNSIASMPAMVDFIKSEIDNFGLDAYEQKFNYQRDGLQFNGTNIYSIIRAERSTSSEAIVLCAPFKMNSNSNTLPSIALALSLTKYFSTKSYWAKDIIILFVDNDYGGASAWLDSYHDINHQGSGYNDDLEERSGPIQAAIVFELYGRKFTRMNIRIQGKYGQLPNLDLFNLVVELAARESVTPYFHNKSMPFDLSNEDLYRHHFETAISFISNQASMQPDGLHGLFLQYAIQSLTLDCPEYIVTSKKRYTTMTSSLLNLGRLIEGIFRSLNNLTERFNRSYYFYMLLSLRRFTSIAYYMTSFGLMIIPLLLKAKQLISDRPKEQIFIGFRALVLLGCTWALSVLSLVNISTAIISALVVTPILILI